MSKSLNIPPLEMIDKKISLRRDYERIILWMLSNNEYCEWGNFIEEPVDIKKSTLSDKLRSLISKGFITKERNKVGKNLTNIYLITSKGRERYAEISVTQEERFNYPPQKILGKRNYDHWILWMTYNNESCSWSTFTTEDSKVRINQSSLSKNINKLLDDEFIIKVNKEYRITPEGRSEYPNMLREYDLDRQSILEEETNRIDEITEKTSEFFEMYEIEEGELKFRFLNNILKLEYSKAEEFVQEDEFNKIILFLSMNHPDYYPNYVSPEEFSLKYGIKKTTLDFFVDKIIEENTIYPIKFFKMIAEDNKVYYFQANGELEKILNAIVEKHITKFTYLNKFHSTSESERKIIDLEQALNQILKKASGLLFNEALKDSLKKFLPEYINYLAYKIETEKKLIRSEDKLEAAQWQTFQSLFQGYNTALILNGNGNGEQYYSLYKMFFEALDVAYLSKIDFVGEREFEEEYISNQNLETFRKIVRMLERNKIAKAKGIFETYDFESVEKLILEDLISNSEKDFKSSILTSEKLISQKPESHVGYLFHGLALFGLHDFEKALTIVEKGLIKSKHYSLFCVRAQILIKKGKAKKALSLIDEELMKNPKNVYLMRTKFIILLTDEGCWYECAEKPLDIIDSIINLRPDDLSFYVLKAAVLCVMQKYKEVKKLLNKEVNLSIVTKNPRIYTAVFFVLAYSYIARGKFEKALRVGDQAIFQYDYHPTSYFTKSLAIGYSLIYDKENKEITEDNFLDAINTALSLDSTKFHQAIYYQLMGDVFLETRSVSEALEAINKAIALDPSNLGLFQIKLKLLMMDNKSDEAIALVNRLYDDEYVDKKDSTKIRSFLIYVKADNTKDPEERMKLINKSFEEIEPIIEENSEDIGILNNLTVLYGHLGRKEEAIRAAETMISLDPSDGNLFDSYGEMLMLFGDYEKAIQKFERALKLEPKGWFAFQTYLKMGTCYEKLFDLEKAEENYLKGKELTDRMHPLKKDIYFYKASEKLDSLRKAREELEYKKV
jgi:tetratricopeptide (TPR) repeat protein/DNA-binding HxlR family transcriptional regulator